MVRSARGAGGADDGRAWAGRWRTGRSRRRVGGRHGERGGPRPGDGSTWPVKRNGPGLPRDDDALAGFGVDGQEGLMPTIDNQNEFAVPRYAPRITQERPGSRAAV